MKLTGVKINNYKSFGEEENFLFVNNLNIVIGKNESGKSNILEALEDIGIIGLSNNELFKKNNRKSDNNVKIELSFDTKKEEKFFYKNYEGDVSVTLEDIDTYKINKKFGEYIINLKEYKDSINHIKLLKDEVPISKPENKGKLEEIIDRFESVDERIFAEPSYYRDFCNYLRNTKNEKITELVDAFDHMIFVLESVYMNFPDFIKIENIDLKDCYTISELKSELEDDNFNSILYQFFIICNIDRKKLIQVMESGNSSKMREYEEEIQEKINQNFVKKFNEFYSQEKLIIAIDIKEDKLDIMIKSTKGAYLAYSERSNGFKWYISIFIQLLYKKNNRENSILLLDEPGVYLHAKAQNELRDLLEELSNKNMQIIYTTHSPFMLKKDNMQLIRALIKDDNGYTCIYNKITTIPTLEKSRYETITPILYALGCEDAYDLGPSDSRLNIITEGITDYFCLIGYSDSIKKEFPYKIISSNGADNVIPIACILYGWGYDFIILLDQDDKGRGVYERMKNANSPYIDKVIFADTSKETNEKIKFEIENIFSEGDRKKFGFLNSDYQDKKYNYVTDMLTKIKYGDEKYDKETIANFNKLFQEVEKFYAGK